MTDRDLLRAIIAALQDISNEIHKLNENIEKNKDHGYFLAINDETGEKKMFKEYSELKMWWTHLSIEDSLNWAGWYYVD